MVIAVERHRERHREQVGGADETHGDAPRGGHLGAHRAEQQRPVQQRDDRECNDAQRDDRGDLRAREGEHRAEQDRVDGAGGVVHGRVQVQQQRRQPEERPEHDARREVAAARALDADQLHDGGRDDIERDDAPQQPHAAEERRGSSGRADVAERLAGERLPAHHREDPDDAGHDRRDGADDDGHAHVFAREEPRLDHRRQQRSRYVAAHERTHAGAHETISTPGSAASCPCRSEASPAPATTSTRPCTLSTSTWLPYSSLSTSARTTSAVVPLAARPAAM